MTEAMLEADGTRVHGRIGARLPVCAGVVSGLRGRASADEADPAIPRLDEVHEALARTDGRFAEVRGAYPSGSPEHG